MEYEMLKDGKVYTCKVVDILTVCAKYFGQYGSYLLWLGVDGIVYMVERVEK